MSIYPVIMCGGSGVRLWPESRSDRPKQFLPLIESRSLFQRTAERMAPLAADGGVLLVIAGAAHAATIREQLAGVGLRAIILAEPSARDSAPAAAAAIEWIARRDADGIAAIVASDHHIEDDGAFRDAIRSAAAGAADGAIVTLGIRPTAPSEAYGYIRPDPGPGLSRVAEFREKPDPATAARYIAEGCLWNSGNFIASVRSLSEELERHAPDVLRAVRQALDGAEATPDGVITLSPAFETAPRVSLDYAVMEKTLRAAVLPVDFAWSDLGAWDAVGEAGGRRRGAVVEDRAETCVIRVAPGMVVGALGVSNLAIIAEPDAVLVCSLDQAQNVKGLVERVRLVQQVDACAPDGLAAAAARTAQWLRTSALPLWGTVGTNPDGSFREAIDSRGGAVDTPRRSRVQTRQVWSYCRAGAHGWNGPWSGLAERGFRAFDRDFRLGDGAWRTRADPGGGAADDTVMLYDQAFVLLAASEMFRLDLDRPGALAVAERVRTDLATRRHPAGGWREAGTHPWQANAHMHLLEAALAWEAVGDDRFVVIADEVVRLATDHFVNAGTGRLHEFFDQTWSAAPGPDGSLVEPGHQFEWAWLLTRHGLDRSSPETLEIGQRLYRTGTSGVDPRRNVAVDVLPEPGRAPGGRARLWPQTERLKAALLLAERADGPDRVALIADAEAALAGLWRYLEPSGGWRDKLLETGTFVDEPAPASSLYHIMAAFDQLALSAPVLTGMSASDLALGAV
jgi:mannose-1-phosphate guanylyltransferase/mannose-6-phosphate isomerase